MAHIVQRLDDGEAFPIDKVRIWDFYLLFPSKLYDIHLRNDEDNLRTARKRFIHKSANPYDYNGDNRKLFEWIRHFQISALSCLVSCGILGKDDYMNDCVCVVNRKALNAFVEKSGSFNAEENNVLSFLGLLSRNMPLAGRHGLKERTRLLEYKYDAE